MKRDSYLDGLKFLLIFLVILGHIKFNAYGIPLTQLIYSFHMPMFVMLSGYFTTAKDWPVFLRWCVKTVGIFVIFCTLHILIGYYFFDRPISPHSYIYPPLALWYLMSLLFWRVAVQLCAAIRLPMDWRMLLLSILLIAPASLIPIGQTFSFQRTFAFLPFFLSGHLMRTGGLFNFTLRQERLPSAILAVALVVCFAAAWFLPLYQPREPVQGGQELLVRYLQTAIAFVICLCLLQLAPRPFVSKFAHLGEYTLYFYLYHTLFIRIQEKVLSDLGITLSLFHALVIAVFYVALIYYMRKVRLFRMLLLSE